MIIRNENPQLGWNWVDPTAGYEGFMDDYGDFIPEWCVML